MFLQTIILSTINHMLSSKLTVLFHNSIPSVWNWKNSFTSRDCVFQTIILSTKNPMLSSKYNILSHNSLPYCQIWIIPLQTRVVFFLKQSFWVPISPCYLQNWAFCPITLFQVIKFEKFLHKQGSWLIF